MGYNYASADPHEWVLGCIRGYYVRYEQLALLINNNFKGSNANTVDLFIDMADIMRKLNGFLSQSKGIINDGLVVASGIINMVGHYRQFFASRYQCDTRVWIVASMSGQTQKLFYSKFIPVADSLDISTRQLYTNNLSLMDLICKNIPNVQVEMCNCEFATKVLQIYDKEPIKNPLICITKDPFAFQICGSQYLSYVLRPRKSNGSDTSYMVTRESVIESYAFELSKKCDQPVARMINPEMISLFMAMTRVPSRGIHTLYMIPTALKKLNALSATGYPYDIDFVLDQFTQSAGGIKNPYELINRFKACDACYIQLEGYKNTPEAKLYNGIVNLYDPAGIKDINNQYFKKYPLDLDIL